MIEGFMGGFQIFHSGIFWGKKIWKVPFGGGGGAVRFKYVFEGWEGVVQNNLKIGLTYTSWVVLPDKVQPKLFCGCFIYMQIFQLSVTLLFLSC